MKSIKQLLDSNPSQVPVCVAADETVIDALKLMAERNIGSVLVMDGDRFLGIFSERDFIRKVTLMDRDPAKTRLGEVIDEKVFYVTPDYKLDEVMALMTEKRMRHMPVLDAQGKLVGIVSIGDIVKDIISEQAFEIEQLERYITG
ncbi:MAG: CBS domain-containing protein [Rhodocyclaceae bacterium]